MIMKPHNVAIARWNTWNDASEDYLEDGSKLTAAILETLVARGRWDLKFTKSLLGFTRADPAIFPDLSGKMPVKQCATRLRRIRGMVQNPLDLSAYMLMDLEFVVAWRQLVFRTSFMRVCAGALQQFLNCAANARTFHLQITMRLGPVWECIGKLARPFDDENHDALRKTGVDLPSPMSAKLSSMMSRVRFTSNSSCSCARFGHSCTLSDAGR